MVEKIIEENERESPKIQEKLEETILSEKSPIIKQESVLFESSQTSGEESQSETAKDLKKQKKNHHYTQTKLVIAQDDQKLKFEAQKRKLSYPIISRKKKRKFEIIEIL
jgi:hypothetical protein